MFQAQVLQFLRSFLGKYVKGLIPEALKISVWQGDVVLKDLLLNVEELNSLKLPVYFKTGFIGSITIKVPWNKLGKESVVALIDRIFILAEPIQENEKERLFEAKKHQLESRCTSYDLYRSKKSVENEAELAVLKAKEKKNAKQENVAGVYSWFSSFCATLVSNLKISITNVHIRYEDTTSNPGKPFCGGITLSKLAAVTIDDNLKETFLSSGAFDKLHKSVDLECLAVYHDSERPPWKVEKQWNEMSSKEWNEVFDMATHEKCGTELHNKSAEEHQYLLRPMNGVLNYHRHGKNEKRDPTVAFQSLSLVLNEVSINISEAQYCDWLRLVEGVFQHKKRVEFSHFRPWRTVFQDPRVWWRYAAQAGLKQHQKAWSHLSWSKVERMCSLRRNYVELYAELLQQKLNTGNKQLLEIEEEVDLEVLLLWRLLARAKVESLKSKDKISESDKVAKSRWWGFGWRTIAANDTSSSMPDDSTQKQDKLLGEFTKEEWEKINELLNYHTGEELLLQDSAESLQMSVNATINETTVRIFDEKRTEILGGSFVKLCVGLSVYPKTSECHVNLLSYGISAPEGPLIKSVSNNHDEHVLSVCYVYQPFGSELDWRLSAIILPCYVMVHYASFERIRKFFKNSHSVNPDIALETAAALQSKFEKVRRAAQAQLRSALEEESRFSIDLDLDAPKIRLPVGKNTKGINTEILLDLGHFTLHTENDGQHINQRRPNIAEKNELYSRCYVRGMDIAAYFVDGLFDWEEMQQFLSSEADNHGSNISPFLPLLDRCGMFLLFEKLRIPDPSYPLMHIALQVPRLGIHFSPGRYERFLQLFATFDGLKDKADNTSSGTSWFPADYEGSAMVLIWKGIGNAIAEWQSCWLVLAGSYLYVLESANSQSYLRCCSMNAKHILEVPSSNVGGSNHVLAVCNREMELKKGLETSSSIIVKLMDQECKEAWLKVLTSSIYKSSIPASLSLSEYFIEEDKELDPWPVDILSQPVLFVSGSLQELELSIYGMAEEKSSNVESIISSLQAGGGKVNVLQRQYDLTVGMKLHYLKIEDKLQGSMFPSCQYIARSLLTEDAVPANLTSTEEVKIKEDEDNFNDALADFGSPSTSPAKLSDTFQADIKARERKSESCIKEMVLTSGVEHFKLNAEESSMDKVLVGDSRSFVSMHILIRQLESPDYDDRDVQMNISMSTLEFFCNRPTVVALINFGTEISEIMDMQSEDSENSIVRKTSADEASDECLVVRGLLGRGKSRIVFQLKMNMDCVRIFLNLEDGTGLATLYQERFEMDLKVFPGSFAISGLLGNLKVYDMTLGPNHHWGWTCDTRNPGCDSLVKLEFQSFNMDEDDYEGYDYSLEGQLSSVRIVFLYRFIQEVTAYFTALSAQHVEQFTRVVDKVGGMEKLVPQSDIDGLPALKLNISLDTPIINIPKSSSSKDFMQLDLGFLKITNRFEWHGGPREDASSIHMDVISAEISGINMIVGMDDQIGKPMIEEVEGLHVRIRRPLRDLFRRVPEVQVDVQVDILRGIISNKEYLLITGCAASNIAETPHLPPDFRVSCTNSEILSSSEVHNLSPLKRESPHQMETAWTIVRVTVEVQSAELELHNGFERESALARVELRDLWLNYRSNSLQEMEFLLSLLRLHILDLRAGIKPEMRLMLGSITDTEADTSSFRQHSVEPQIPMVVLDTKIKEGLQASIIRIQKLRLLVVLDFLLAVGEFFVPSVASLTGKNGCNDPIVYSSHIRLVEPYYEQQESILTLSSHRKLIADFPDINEFTYDGCGNTLCILMDESVSDGANCVPVIHIGAGKKIAFKNVKIKNAERLKDCVRLHPYSSYSVRVEDGVILDRTSDNCDYVHSEILVGSHADEKSGINQSSSDAVSNFTLDVQAIAPELTFYDSDRTSAYHGEKLLRVKMDLNLIYACKKNDVWLRSYVKRFSVDGGSGLCVIEPMVVSMEYACVNEKTSMHFFASDVSVQLSFSLIRLLLRVYNNVMSTFGQALSRCSHFDRIWVNSDHTTGKRFTIWRPRPPPGYVILSDSITSGEAPPTQAVMAVKDAFYRVRRPLSYDLIWVLSNSTEECSIWRPVAPPGYVALGCISKIGLTPPPLGFVYCIRVDLVTSTSINDCMLVIHPYEGSEAKFSMWRVDNAAGSFLAHLSTDRPTSLYDFRDILYEDNFNSFEYGNRSTDQKSRKVNQEKALLQLDYLDVPQKDGRFISMTTQFERMWWDKGSAENRRPISIWRPIPPPGYAIVGDHLVEGLEPPTLGIVLQDDNSGRILAPIDFVLHMHIQGKGLEELHIWYPLPPEGYVTMGVVVTKDEDTTILKSFRCVRADLVKEVNISNKPAWSMYSGKGSAYHIWKVQNQEKTFFVQPVSRKSSECFKAYGLVQTVQATFENKSSVDVKIPKFSVTICDDLRGIVTPLGNITITSINIAASGHTEAFSGACIAHVAASTFNTQVGAWEPFVELFEGIFKCESQETPSGPILKIGISTANILNVNATSANIDILLDSILSWKRRSESEIKALQNIKDDEDTHKTSISSALEDDIEKLSLENKLDCKVFVCTFEELKNYITLESGKSFLVKMPPPNFTGKFTSEGTKIPVRHVTIYVSEAKDLPVNDDGNAQEYFYSLHIPSSKMNRGQKTLNQSARSKCVRPSSISNSVNGLVASASWNEVFVFDLPHEDDAKVDIRINNKAASSGRGELLGLVSLPLVVDNDLKTKSNSHWNLVRQSISRLNYPNRSIMQEKTCCLTFQTKKKSSDMSTHVYHGSLVVTICYYIEGTSQLLEESDNRDQFQDTGLQVGLTPTGPWMFIQSSLPLGTSPIKILNNHIALDVTMNDGLKVATLRSLVRVFNQTDSSLEICVSPLSSLNNHDETSSPVDDEPLVVVEEIFENQRYQILAGWGSRWPGHFLPTDPRRWSTRDLQKSSQSWENIEPSLPAGWKWNSDWSIDKAGYVDDDGWAYGPDFQSLRWPPNSLRSRKRSSFDFIRRRRWCRSRLQIAGQDEVKSRRFISVIEPGANIPISIASILSTREYCLLVRPLSETTTKYLWGRSVPVNRDYGKGDGQSSTRKHSANPLSSFTLNNLQKVEELIMCPPENPIASRTAWWLSIASDSDVLYDELSSHVDDWRILVNSPLKLENLLPCNAEYTIWERHREGSHVQRDRGVVSAGGHVNIFSVDVRRPIYLTWLVQGGWRLEKEMVLISDPSTDVLPTTFSLINQQSGRRLQISLERDFGSSNASVKTLRIFVPYWICNKAAIPLSYSIVEVELVKGSDAETPWLLRAVKAAKHADSRPSHTAGIRSSRISRVIQCLEYLENSGGSITMLSPQTQLSRQGFMPFSPKVAAEKSLLPPRLGISVCASYSNDFKDGISIKDLEDNEHITIRAMDGNGAYYKLSVHLSMSSERTKVINFQPHALFVNRLGQTMFLRQYNIACSELLYPNDPPKVLFWQTYNEPELIQIFIQGYKWSTPFSVENEGISHIILESEGCCDEKILVRVDIQNGVSDSRYLVIFRYVSFASPYRIENQSITFSVRFRQLGGCDSSWQLLPPGSAVPFAWEDLQKEHKLEIMVDGVESQKSKVIAIDKCSDYEFVRILREGFIQVVRICGWMQGNESLAIIPIGSTKAPSMEQLESSSTKKTCNHPQIECQVRISFNLSEVGLSLVDHTPQELLYVSMQNLSVDYATGPGGICRWKIRLGGLQIDNQLPLAPMPVLLSTQIPVNPSDFILKFTLTMRDDKSLNRFQYSYIGIQCPSTTNAPFVINIHESIIWWLHQMFQQLDLSRLTTSQTTDVSVDPIINIGLLHSSEIRFKVSLAMSPSQRPRGALGFWASLMTALGNTDDLQVRIAPRVYEDICMRQSSLIAACISGIKKDLLSHPLLLLSGVDILGNASSALGNMSKGIAVLSMDKKFIKSRERQDTKASVEGFGDGFREGAEALGKGLFRGVTGILTKPLEGAKTSGMEGFVQGVGKGIIGVAAQPVSGVLDLLSKTAEGANAMKTKIAAVITSEGVVSRHRLPRVIGADKILRPYDEFKAQGQVLLQLAECSSIFGPIDIFKIRGKFAMSDIYEVHYDLPKARTLIITHQRVILLQSPTSTILQKKPDLTKDSCLVLWDVRWEDLGSMELSSGKHDLGRPSRLNLHIRDKDESRETVRVVKCDPNTDQAGKIRASIQEIMTAYGPDALRTRTRKLQARNALRPYSGPIENLASLEDTFSDVYSPSVPTFFSLLANTN